MVLFTSSQIRGGHVENTIGINFEANFNLRNTFWCWWNSIEVEFTKLMVVLGLSSFTFENTNFDSCLVIVISRVGLSLLGWDLSISIDDVTHNTSNCLDTHRKRGNIKEKKFIGLLVSLSGKNSSLNSGTVSNSLIRVDGFVESPSVEEFGEHGLNLWDSSRSTNKNDFLNLGLTKLGILEDVLNWRHALFEKIQAELLELGSGEVGVVIFTFSKSFTFNWGLMCT